RSFARRDHGRADVSPRSGEQVLVGCGFSVSMAEGVLRTPAFGIAGRWERIERLLRSDVCAFVILVVLPSPVYILELRHAVTGDRIGSDFLSFWQAGRSVLHGQSPYPALSSLPSVAHSLTFAPFVYPAPAAYWMVPFALLPFAV